MITICLFSQLNFQIFVPVPNVLYPFQARLLRDLVNRLRVTTSPKSSGGAGMNAFEAWNDATEEVQELAKAHIDRQMVCRR